MPSRLSVAIRGVDFNLDSASVPPELRIDLVVEEVLPYLISVLSRLAAPRMHTLPLFEVGDLLSVLDCYVNPDLTVHFELEAVGVVHENRDRSGAT